MCLHQADATSFDTGKRLASETLYPSPPQHCGHKKIKEPTVTKKLTTLDKGSMRAVITHSLSKKLISHLNEMTNKARETNGKTSRSGIVEMLIKEALATRYDRRCDKLKGE